MQPLFNGDVIAVGCESIIPLVMLRRQGRNLEPFQCPVQGTRAMSFPGKAVQLYYNAMIKAMTTIYIISNVIIVIIIIIVIVSIIAL